MRRGGLVWLMIRPLNHEIKSEEFSKTHIEFVADTQLIVHRRTSAADDYFSVRHACALNAGISCSGSGALG